MRSLLVALLVAFSASLAHADAASVKKAVEARLHHRVDAVRKTPYLGLYEVRSGNEIIYTDGKVTYLFAGNIIDAKTMNNITQARIRQISAISFADLPLGDAVKIVHGNGKRVIATFEDPNCPYCRRLAAQLKEMDNITVYTFLYPILSRNSYYEAKAIWCAPDRAKAWSEMMLRGIAPRNKGACKTPIHRNLVLGERLNINGTPTIFLVDGERIAGAVPRAQLESLIVAATAKATGKK